MFPFFLILQTTLIVPLVEEILFRGLIFHCLAYTLSNFFKETESQLAPETQEKYVALFAVLGSASLFALVHGSMLILVQIFLMGVILGMLRVYTRSLYPCIAFHILHNAIVCVKLDYLSDFVSP